jgi:hypothetical protein
VSLARAKPTSEDTTYLRWVWSVRHSSG